MNSSFFSDLMTSIADRGRAVLARPTSAGLAPTSAADVAALARDLASRRGEASGVARAREIFTAWDGLDKDARRDFLIALANDFGPDAHRLDTAITVWREERTPAALQELHAAAEPKRQEVIRRLNLAPRGTSKLVSMREELFEHQKSHPVLDVLDEDFRHLFSSWFNPGFLVLRRIDWSTPASILEKIIRYEAVHAIRDWKDLRRRIEPEDRRLFAFFHPQMVDNPLIFVEVALADYMPSAIEPLLAEVHTPCPPERATTAVFYSISNCQEGLRGVSFGNFLIKHVVEELRRELPKLSTFVTLSPVPGFANWLARERRSEATVLAQEDLALLRNIDDPAWTANDKIRELVQPALLSAAATYLLTARTTEGKPVDPVARFHLGNGAQLERLNYLGNTSAKGLAQAHGMMVNYLYDLAKIEHNHEAFAEKGHVVSSPAVQKHLKTGRPGPGASTFNGERAATSHTVRVRV
jgi:malonyl-CoA decarboxylase